MARRRSITRVVTWPAIAVSAGVLASTPAGAATEQGIFLDLTNALQSVSNMSSQISLPPAPVETSTHDFALLGVVIAGERRLALIQRAAGQELLSLGQSLAGYRLIDVEEAQATLEGQRGDRVVLRLPTGGGPGAVAAQPNPAPSSAASLTELIKAKEDRAAKQAERNAQEKARALRERGASPGPKE